MKRGFTLFELLIMIVFLSLSAVVHHHDPQSSSAPIVLTRNYAAGQKVAYQMDGLNEQPGRKQIYKALAEGAVRQDPSGFFEEELWWKSVTWDKQTERFEPSDKAAEQILTLDPKAPFRMPDLSHASRNLIGPITDLMTFYVDLLLPMRAGALKKPGDHFYVPFGRPSSWADGTRVKVGYDLIDFDVKLKSVDRAKNRAIVLVRHVPPKEAKSSFPADWMKDSGRGTPNNWIEVSREPNGHFKAAFGIETFDVTIAVDLGTGEIRNAQLENIVDVTERTCDDESLSNPGPPHKYRIHRRIVIKSQT